MRNFDIAEGARAGALLITDGAVVVDRPQEVVLAAARPQVAAQVTPGHVLEEQAHGPADGAHAQELDDVGVVELGQDAGLAFEVLDEVLSCLFLQHLDRHHGELLTLHEPRSLGLKGKS